MSSSVPGTGAQWLQETRGYATRKKWKRIDFNPKDLKGEKVCSSTSEKDSTVSLYLGKKFAANMEV